MTWDGWSKLTPGGNYKGPSHCHVNRQLVESWQREWESRHAGRWIVTGKRFELKPVPKTVSVRIEGVVK